MAIRFPVNGPVMLGVVPANGDRFTLAELQEFTGYQSSTGERKPGFIEPIFLHSGDVLIENEDARLLHLPVNDHVLQILRMKIYGDAVLLSAEEWAKGMESTEDVDTDEDDLDGEPADADAPRVISTRVARD